MKLRVLVLAALLALVTTAQPLNASGPCTAPPTTEVSLIGIPLDDTWHRDWALLTFSASSDCGVEETLYRINGGEVQVANFFLQISTSGMHTLEAWSVDTSGHVGPSTFTTFGIDRRPDVVNNVAGPIGQNGWFVGPVTVSYTATDDRDTPMVEYVVGAGAWSPYQGPFVVATDGNQNVTALATDRWWLGSGVDSFELRIDTVAPEVTLLRPEAGTLYVADQGIRPPALIEETTIVGTVTLEAEATDATSGVQSVRFLVDDNVLCVDTEAPYTCEWDSSVAGAGEHTLAAEAVDLAGHVAHDARTVQVLGL